MNLLNYLLKPFRNALDFYKTKTIKTANYTLESLFRIGIILLIFITLVWIAVFFYIIFYYAYVPAIMQTKPVFFQYENCEEDKSTKCGYPKAHIQLTKYDQALMAGQPYRFTLQLEMPESPKNKELGVFMICGQLTSKNAVTLSHSCQPTILRYKSPLVHLLRTLTFAPFYIWGTLEEKQTIIVDLLPNYVEDHQYPVSDMYIELKSNSAQIYSAKLHIDAHLAGLRYLMFYWPTTSAFFGISFIFFIILFIASVSMYQIYGLTDTESRRDSAVKLIITKRLSRLRYKPKAKVNAKDESINKSTSEEEEEKKYKIYSEEKEKEEKKYKIYSEEEEKEEKKYKTYSEEEKSLSSTKELNSASDEERNSPVSADEERIQEIESGILELKKLILNDKIVQSERPLDVSASAVLNPSAIPKPEPVLESINL